MGLGSNRKTYPPCPEGDTRAVLVDIVNLGLVKNAFGKEQIKVMFTWQTNHMDESGKPYLAFKRYTDSLHEKSALYKDLKAWFKKDIDTVVAAVEKDETYLLGKGCRLEIEHSDDGKYANVARVMQDSEKEPLKVHPEFLRKKDRKDGEGPFGSRKEESKGEASDPEDGDVHF